MSEILKVCGKAEIPFEWFIKTEAVDIDGLKNKLLNNEKFINDLLDGIYCYGNRCVKIEVVTKENGRSDDDIDIDLTEGE